jgi:hypothetical protein
MIHTKKVWPEYFQAIVDGKKNFELRLADWSCEEGDEIVLREWNPNTKKYTGREITKKIGLVICTKDVNFWSKEEIEKHGFQIISLI